MNNFFVVTNTYKDVDFKVTKYIRDYLVSKGKTCHINHEIISCKDCSALFTDPSFVPADTECIIVLGGDGTLMQAARDLAARNIPFIGVNFGKLGYLAEISQDNITQTLDMLIDNSFRIEKRIMIEGTVTRNDAQIAKNLALNDIVINRIGLSVIDFNVYVNDILLNSYTADGIIISTPTGSTAYNLSAGGPILEPNADIVALTPICPHTLNNRSVVLSANDKIEIEICKDRTRQKEEKMLAFDGCQSVILLSGDRVVINKHQLETKIIKLSNMSFIETLQKKMSYK